MRSVIVNLEIRWVNSGSSNSSNSCNRRRPIPVYISTNPSHINPQQIKHLYTTCNHSSHRFPRLDVDPAGDRAVVEPLDINKLRLALSHSAVVISVFSSPHLYASDDDEISTKQQLLQLGTKEATRTTMGLGDLLQKVNIPIPIPLPPLGELVGFGRAVSDLGLTASIYDVMVIPSLRRMGIGKMIVKRILRMLTSRDVYDIAALCSPDESLFFKACGFGDDILGSTTMMYTRPVSSCGEGDHLVKCAGRKVLPIPPLTVPSKSFKTSRR